MCFYLYIYNLTNQSADSTSFELYLSSIKMFKGSHCNTLEPIAIKPRYCQNISWSFCSTLTLSARQNKHISCTKAIKFKCNRLITFYRKYLNNNMDWKYRLWMCGAGVDGCCYIEEFLLSWFKYFWDMCLPISNLTRLKGWVYSGKNGFIVSLKTRRFLCI